MYSGWYLIAKSNPIAYSKSKLLITTDTLQNGPLFGVLYKEEKPGDFSPPKNGRTEKWCIRTDKSHCIAEYFFLLTLIKLLVNFLHKLYQKYVK